MTKKIHNWEEKLKVGKLCELILDERLSSLNEKLPEGVHNELQRYGIDRILLDRGFKYGIEYKADFVAARTKNIFLETHRNTNFGGRPGWGFTSISNRIFYYVPPLGFAFCFSTDLIKNRLVFSETLPYRVGYSQNQGYKGKGFLIPFAEAERLFSIYTLDMPIFKNEEELLSSRPEL